MKKLLTTAFCVIVIFSSQLMAQGNKSDRPSPPAQATATIDGINVTIDYSQPSLKGRNFGSADFCPYGKVWRNGANEATWIEVSADVMINGSKLAKGKYSFYAIPGESEWTLIFNSKADQWGTQYSDKSDVLRVKATSKPASATTSASSLRLSVRAGSSVGPGTAEDAASWPSSAVRRNKTATSSSEKRRSLTM